MRFIALLAAISQVGMLLYVTSAACQYQRGDKENAMRAVGITAIAVIVFATTLQILADGHFVLAVREVSQVGFIGSCVAATTAVYLLKRSMGHCEKRKKHGRE